MSNTIRDANVGSPKRSSPDHDGPARLRVSHFQGEAEMGKPVLRTKLCDMLGIDYPVLSAGAVDILSRRLPETVLARA